MNGYLPLVAGFLVAGLLVGPSQGEWRPADGPLSTRWAKDVSPDNAWPEYPRPQMVREDWLNLNGLWEYAIQPLRENWPPKRFEGSILVPFPVESALSGVMKHVGAENTLCYRRTIQGPGGLERSTDLAAFWGGRLARDRVGQRATGRPT